MKKNKKIYPMPEFDLTEARSATEFTGLIPRAPINDYELNSYKELIGYSPETIDIYSDK